MRSRGPAIKNSEVNTHFRLATAALGRIAPEQPDDLLLSDYAIRSRDG